MLASVPVEAWYALYTKPRLEFRVARTLTARGFHVFLPLVPVQPHEHVQPLFPTYLFLCCDLPALGLSTLQWIPGLRRVLSFNGRPAIVPQEAIDLIHACLRNAEAAGGLPNHPFKPGDEVVIEEGPLAGLYGIFQGPVGPAERVHVLLRFLGYANRAQVPVTILRATENGPHSRQGRRGTRGQGRRIRYG